MLLTSTTFVVQSCVGFLLSQILWKSYSYSKQMHKNMFSILDPYLATVSYDQAR